MDAVRNSQGRPPRAGGLPETTQCGGPRTALRPLLLGSHWSPSCHYRDCHMYRIMKCALSHLHLWPSSVFLRLTRAVVCLDSRFCLSEAVPHAQLSRACPFPCSCSSGQLPGCGSLHETTLDLRV